MEKEIFTGKVSGSAFYAEAKKGFEIKEMKNNKLFFISASATYPKGYISDEASHILREAKAAGEKLSAAIGKLTFAFINTEDGDSIPALIKTPEAPKTFWSAEDED